MSSDQTELFLSRFQACLLVFIRVSTQGSLIQFGDVCKGNGEGVWTIQWEQRQHGQRAWGCCWRAGGGFSSQHVAAMLSQPQSRPSRSD